MLNRMCYTQIFELVGRCKGSFFNFKTQWFEGVHFFLKINICLRLLALNCRCFSEIYEDTKLISNCTLVKVSRILYHTIKSNVTFKEIQIAVTGDNSCDIIYI